MYVTDYKLASSAEDNANSNSWNTQGDMQALLESFKQFPDWCKRLFKHSSELGLWQLRDLDPLDTWTKGRVIIIGDASHAMLPTQGQGASQSIEDAEAVGSFFSEVSSKPTTEEVQAITKMAKPATEVGDIRIKLNLAQFMDYNCLYDGAKDWLKRQAAPESA
ncbi:hypothetical protein V502_09971 [Pseudogymnoascus sp. VKM F-4520 (FW-2644)]|nr:hypothetical protein V502_09971 [Pseudogymnoascus sp. VKM F-4520 (FW-2644)]